MRHYRDTILAWAGAGVVAAAAAPPSRARSPAKKRPGEGEAAATDQLIPPGGIDSAEVETPMSPEKAVAGLLKGASSLNSAWEETSAKARKLVS